MIDRKLEFTHVMHTFEPIFDKKSQILILGSFPSVKSRENQFYYGHPQNRFWKVMAGVFREETPKSISEKKSFLLRNRLAVWDVIASCDIVGSSDSSIKNVVPNDMDMILNKTSVKSVIANGEKSYQLFLKYCKKAGQPEISKLPSTSPANAAWSVERLIEVWGTQIRKGNGVEDSYEKR